MQGENILIVESGWSTRIKDFVKNVKLDHKSNISMYKMMDMKLVIFVESLSLSYCTIGFKNLNNFYSIRFNF